MEINEIFFNRIRIIFSPPQPRPPQQFPGSRYFPIFYFRIFFFRLVKVCNSVACGCQEHITNIRYFFFLQESWLSQISRGRTWGTQGGRQWYKESTVYTTGAQEGGRKRAQVAQGDHAGAPEGHGWYKGSTGGTIGARGKSGHTHGSHVHGSRGAQVTLEEHGWHRGSIDNTGGPRWHRRISGDTRRIGIVHVTNGLPLHQV